MVSNSNKNQMIISRFDEPALVESNVPRTELTSSSDIKQNIIFFFQKWQHGWDLAVIFCLEPNETKRTNRINHDNNDELIENVNELVVNHAALDEWHDG